MPRHGGSRVILSPPGARGNSSTAYRSVRTPMDSWSSLSYHQPFTSATFAGAERSVGSMLAALLAHHTSRPWQGKVAVPSPSRGPHAGLSIGGEAPGGYLASARELAGARGTPWDNLRRWSSLFGARGPWFVCCRPRQCPPPAGTHSPTEPPSPNTRRKIITTPPSPPSPSLPQALSAYNSLPFPQLHLWS